MFNWLIKLYYKIPTMHWRNPIRFENRDDREFQWYQQRKKYGFDECVLWNLGSYLHDRICKFLKLDASVTSDMAYKMPYDDFRKWFEKDADGVKWIARRLEIYIKWDCPTFYLDADYKNLPPDQQVEILNKMASILNDRISGSAVTEEDIKFLQEHIFHLGW